jgi:L-lactate dehydrogenase complex protein LldG
MSDDVLDKVRRALGRTAPLTQPPVPPPIDESITRLAIATGTLAQQFARMCEENKMHVTLTSPDELPEKLADFLRNEKVRRVALAGGGILEKLNLAASLRQAGFDAQLWRHLTLDDLYDFDCGVTNVDFAVAETGTLVVRASPAHGRALSLVPPIHVAVVEQANLLQDLVDLFQSLTSQGLGSAVSLITGPSKTSDIEMNLVVGVHGPMKVQVFLV